MAEAQISPPDLPVEETVASAPSQSSGPPPTSTAPTIARPPPIHHIYRQPAPIRVFPFPSFSLTPLSLAHLAVTWLRQVLNPPAAEPSFVHTAFWDHETRTLYVTDDKSMMDLWQQGFYGKGSLSRSEPNWLKREKIRRGIVEGRVAEVVTNTRREERTRIKWERARAEQEALEEKRLKEARVVNQSLPPTPPLWPAELLVRAPVGPLELLALPNSAPLHSDTPPSWPAEVLVQAPAVDASTEGSASSGNDDADSSTPVSEPTLIKRRKSVRFSPNVESAVFQHTDPPSPPRSVSASSLKPSPCIESNGGAHADGDASALSDRGELSQSSSESDIPVEVAVVNKEHLQLTPEEVFFLTYALGVLRVVDSATEEVLSTEHLFTLLRQNSYFPPRISQQHLQPDDPFLVHYAVYHHFRSLGFVPRAGIKFGVDWLIYMRGPVFDHAEYAVIVLPSYAHPEWKSNKKQAPTRSWQWLMGVNRVLSKVFKSLVLVYVDIPPPSAFDDQGRPQRGVADLLKQYKMREQMVKRWSSNRNR